MRVYVSSLIPEIRAEALYASDCVRLDDRSDRLRLNLFQKISSKTDNKLYSLIHQTQGSTITVANFVILKLVNF